MKRIITYFGGLLIIIGAAMLSLLVFNRYQDIAHDLDVIKQSCEHTSQLVRKPTHVVEKTVAGSQLWRPVQDRVRDTVVQVLVHASEIDMLQPYKTPHQSSSAGSGFFINDQGDIITNAHVVDQARAIWIQVPSLGKRIIDAQVVGIAPERDLALLRISPSSLEMIQRELGSVQHLPFGDSDLIHRSDEVLALGYPLGQQSLKSTTGVVSGNEQCMIQTSAPINPGNSGGPLLNVHGEVVGINTAMVQNAQNVGYAIPVNDLKIVLPDLYKTSLLRKPYLGIYYNNANDALLGYLKNPQPGGCYVVEVVKGSTLDKAGVEQGDMVYAINGYPVDMFGEMIVPWCDDKISIIDFVSRLAIGQELRLTVYRNGQRKDIKATFEMAQLPTIRRIYPGYEEIDYEVFGGMVVMQLSLNHIQGMHSQAPGLAKFAEMRFQANPVLLITHIFPTSQLYRSRAISVGSTLNEVNGRKVHTLDDLRAAFKDSLATNILTMRASDHVARATDNIFIALDWKEVLAEELKLSHDYRYPLTQTAKDILQAAHVQDGLEEQFIGAQTVS